MHKELFQHQENKPKTENQNRCKGTVVFYIPVKKRIRAYPECQGNHSPFKKYIMDYVDSEDWKCGHEDWQQSTMNGTGNGSGNSQGVPV